MSKKYRSEAMASIHETMETLHKVGTIDKQTMRRFDDAFLTPLRAADGTADQGYPGAGARKLDGVCELSQRDAESCKQVGRGEKHLPGPALRLLSRSTVSWQLPEAIGHAFHRVDCIIGLAASSSACFPLTAIGSRNLTRGSVLPGPVQ